MNKNILKITVVTVLAIILFSSFWIYFPTLIDDTFSQYMLILSIMATLIVITKTKNQIQLSKDTQKINNQPEKEKEV